MKKILALLFIMLTASIIQAQSISNLFAQMDKLAAKAKGQTFINQENALYSEKVKLVSQEFSQSSVICSKKNKREDEVTTYSSIPWDDIKKVHYSSADGNNKLIVVNIAFNSLLKSKEMYESSTFNLTVYVLRNDAAKAKDIMDKIIEYFRKG